MEEDTNTEPFLIEDLLYALVGIEGRYISIKRIRGKEGYVVFQIDTSMDLALQELTSRIFPLCEGYVLVNHFVESRSHFENGFVNHALAAAIRAFLLDYQAMVAQLEHQFRLGKLSSQGLWFFCQRMMSSMDALAVLVEKAITDNVSGSATLNLLESQESLTEDYDAKYWEHRYKLKDGVPSFLRSVSHTILTTGKYLNVMRECGHQVQEKVSLQKTLYSLKDLPGPVSGANDTAIEDPELAEPLNITGLETFYLRYKVQWPLSLVISRKALTKYQMIFRLLFHCKHVSCQLFTAWQLHQGFCACKILGTPISRSSILCRSMLKFINSLLHYLTFEVLEPNWQMMHDGLLTGKSIDEVIEFHDLFLHKCLKECLLLMPPLLKKVEKLKALCLRYATSIQVLIPSMNMLPERDAKLATTARIKQSQLKEQQLKLALEKTVISDSIMKFENEFNVELQSLVPILSRNNSQSKPYLTHLPQCILGIRADQ
ncbi:hypothetical protein LUZ61_014216 [Rhynchospora tenuis]|uniref:Gamma-tubulin complex component n=1 Tax=Rhynchospora tenuis TaxID=198213 RepID=A0AAD5WAN2_9POAL|nr:hypothetical protein LUZ61_014216 [Rhynchospora tenuis]